MSFTMEQLNSKFCDLELEVKNLENKTLVLNNEREQYTRNWACRFIGVDVSSQDVFNLGVVDACLLTAYNRVIEPVLQQAVTDGKISKVPHVWDLLENGHFIGTAIRSRDYKDEEVWLPPAIIVRFVHRRYRNIFLRYKGKNMPTPSDQEKADGILRFSASPDLTKMNHLLLKRLADDKRTSKVWSIDGRIRFTLNSEHPACIGCNYSAVFKVPDILEPVNKIIISAIQNCGPHVSESQAPPSGSKSTPSSSKSNNFQNSFPNPSGRRACQAKIIGGARRSPGPNKRGGDRGRGVGGQGLSGGRGGYRGHGGAGDPRAGFFHSTSPQQSAQSPTSRGSGQDS